MKNKKINHNIPINALVEISNGCRLYVFSLGWDCNGTPLYNLSGKPIIYSDFISWEELKRCFIYNIFFGYSEEELKVIHTNKVNQEKPKWLKTDTNLF